MIIEIFQRSVCKLSFRMQVYCLYVALPWCFYLSIDKSMSYVMLLLKLTVDVSCNYESSSFCGWSTVASVAHSTGVLNANLVWRIQSRPSAPSGGPLTDRSSIDGSKWRTKCSVAYLFIYWVSFQVFNTIFCLRMLASYAWTFISILSVSYYIYSLLT